MPAGIVLPGDYFIASASFTASGTAFTAGNPYQKMSDGNWIPVDSSDMKRMLSCLGGALDDPSIDPSTGAIYGWFKNIAAKNAVIEALTAGILTAEKLKAVQGLFDSITVTGKSQFNGKISSDVLETQIEDSTGGQTVSGSGGSFSEGNANTISAQGLLGSSVIENLKNYFNTLADKSLYAASGSILGNSNFNSAMRASSVSSSLAVLSSLSGSSGMTTQSLSWTNSKPVDIIVHVSSCAKTTRESYEVTVEEWETSFDSSYETWGTKPANESAPSPANVGDTYYT